MHQREALVPGGPVSEARAAEPRGSIKSRTHAAALPQPLSTDRPSTSARAVFIRQGEQDPGQAILHHLARIRRQRSKVRPGLRVPLGRGNAPVRSGLCGKGQRCQLDLPRWDIQGSNQVFPRLWGFLGTGLVARGASWNHIHVVLPKCARLCGIMGNSS